MLFKSEGVGGFFRGWLPTVLRESLGENIEQIHLFCYVWVLHLIHVIQHYGMKEYTCDFYNAQNCLYSVFRKTLYFLLLRWHDIGFYSKFHIFRIWGRGERSPLFSSKIKIVHHCEIRINIWALKFESIQVLCSMLWMHIHYT